MYLRDTLYYRYCQMLDLIALFFIFTLEGHKFNNKKISACIQKFLDFYICVKAYLNIFLEKLKIYLYNTKKNAFT